MFRVVLLSAAILYWQSGAHCARIFAILPFPSRSHFRPVEALLKGLAQKGHTVDFATHYPSGEDLPNYHELSIEGSIPLQANNLSIHHYGSFTTYHFIKYGIENAGIDACRAVFSTPVIQSLKPKRYDLVITQILGSDCFLGFGHLFDAPVVSIVAMTDLPWASDRVGNPSNPSYVPNWYRFTESRMSFYGRVKNTVLWLTTRFLYHYLSSKGSNQVAREFFGSSTPSLESLAQKTALVLTSGGSVRPTVPNYVQVGGIQIHLNDSRVVDAKGVIYLSMGSMLMTQSFDVGKLQGIFDAFAVLWKGDPEKFPESLVIPGNVHFEKWMPQVDILCHPNTKLFVTHGGLFGSQEATYCGVPRLGIPLYADQVGNIEAAEEEGSAIKVAYGDISKEMILEAARKLLDDKSYAENARRMSRIFRDRPMSPLDTAIYWVEYVMRHRGAPHLRTMNTGYYRVDVGIALVASILLTTILLVTYIFFLLFFSSPATKVKTIPQQLTRTR